MEENLTLREQFPQHVAILCKPGQAIVQTLDWRDAHLVHMALGVAGEAGELVDAVKKAAIYLKPIDIENVTEELGDLAFYMQGIMNHLGISWDQVLKMNIEKLSSRYPEGYSNEAAQARLDKL